MTELDRGIDALYRAPLGEFTAARNALAKRAGPADAARVKQLAKPTVPAWAVNQLYWRERRTYDALVKASEALRKAHRQLLAGRQADLPAIEAAHRDALKAATAAIRAILQTSGEAATPATMAAVSETLQALPSDDPPGRLTRPLRPLGFEALGTLPTRSSLRAVPKPVPAATPDAGAAKREADAAKREAARVAKALDAARRAEKEAHARRVRAQKALAAAERARDTLQEKLDAATAEVQRLRGELSDSGRAVENAVQERERLERALARLRD
ncbi:MAG: hypothetical protein AB1635_17095 [Acidobacteriota bacterium]